MEHTFLTICLPETVILNLVSEYIVSLK